MHLPWQDLCRLVSTCWKYKWSLIAIPIKSTSIDWTNTRGSDSYVCIYAMCVWVCVKCNTSSCEWWRVKVACDFSLNIFQIDLHAKNFPLIFSGRGLKYLKTYCRNKNRLQTHSQKELNATKWIFSNMFASDLNTATACYTIIYNVNSFQHNLNSYALAFNER